MALLAISDFILGKADRLSWQEPLSVNFFYRNQSNGNLKFEISLDSDAYRGFSHLQKTFAELLKSECQYFAKMKQTHVLRSLNLTLFEEKVMTRFRRYENVSEPWWWHDEILKFMKERITWFLNETSTCI